MTTVPVETPLIGRKNPKASREITWAELEPLLKDENRLFTFYGQLSAAQLRQCRDLLTAESEQETQWPLLCQAVSRKILQLEKVYWSRGLILGGGLGVAGMVGYALGIIWLYDNVGDLAALLSVIPGIVFAFLITACLVLGSVRLFSSIGDNFDQELADLKNLRDEIVQELTDLVQENNLPGTLKSN